MSPLFLLPAPGAFPIAESSLSIYVIIDVLSPDNIEAGDILG